jgi:hypothetical protein
MIVLPACITGYHRPSEPPPARWPRHWLEDRGGKLARQWPTAHWTGLQTRPGANCYWGHWPSPDGQDLTIWANVFFPWVGWQVGGFWVDRPDLAPWLGEGFTVLPAPWLATPLDSGNEVSSRAVAQLRHEEFAQMAHYQPTTLGELVFHQWDQS